MKSRLRMQFLYIQAQTLCLEIHAISMSAIDSIKLEEENGPWEWPHGAACNCTLTRLTYQSTVACFVLLYTCSQCYFYDILGTRTEGEPRDGTLGYPYQIERGNEPGRASGSAVSAGATHKVPPPASGMPPFSSTAILVAHPHHAFGRVVQTTPSPAWERGTLAPHRGPRGCNLTSAGLEATQRLGFFFGFLFLSPPLFQRLTRT